MFVFKGAFSILNIIARILRFGLVSGLTLGAVLYSVDGFTDSSYGVYNLYLIVGLLSFLPLLTGTFVEFFFMMARRDKRKSRIAEGDYESGTADKEAALS